MKKSILLLVLLAFAACSKVPVGNVGIKVYLLGGAKGVNTETLGVGRYWIGFNEQLFIFPTFEQQYVWSKESNEGGSDDESMTFQDKDGTQINADFAISYHIDPSKVSLIFQKYQRGLGDITHIFLRSQIRDALNRVSSQMPVEDIYGPKKAELMSNALRKGSTK